MPASGPTVPMQPADPAQVVEVVEPAHADVASAAVAVRAVVRHEDVEPARAVVAGEVAHQRCVGSVPVNEDDRAVSRAGCGKVIAGQPCAVVRGDGPALVRRGSHPCPALALGRGRGGGDQVAVVGGLVADWRLPDDRRVDQGRREPGRGRGCETRGGSQDAGRPGGHDRAPAGHASTADPRQHPPFPPGRRDPLTDRHLPSLPAAFRKLDTIAVLTALDCYRYPIEEASRAGLRIISRAASPSPSGGSTRWGSWRRITAAVYESGMTTPGGA